MSSFSRLSDTITCSAPLCCVVAAEEHVSPNFGSKTSTWLNTMRGKNKNMGAV